MIAEGVRPPGAEGAGGGLGVQKIPRQFQPHWWEMMDALPSQVLRPLRDAVNGKFSVPHRRRCTNQARNQLDHYSRDLHEWMQSVEAMMQRHGEPHVDKLDAAQAEAFHSSLTESEHKALTKCQRVRAAIAYGHMTFEWLDSELSRG